MRGREFIPVAADAAGRRGEAYWRTAAGRAYYGVMLDIRDALTAWGLSAPAQAFVHQTVRRRLFASRDAALKQIGIGLDDLRLLRGVADYETGAVPAFASPAAAQAAYQTARDLLARFDTLRADGPRRDAAFAEIQKAIP